MTIFQVMAVIRYRRVVCFVGDSAKCDFLCFGLPLDLKFAGARGRDLFFPVEMVTMNWCNKLIYLCWKVAFGAHSAGMFPTVARYI